MLLPRHRRGALYVYACLMHGRMLWMGFRRHHAEFTYMRPSPPLQHVHTQIFLSHTPFSITRQAGRCGVLSVYHLGMEAARRLDKADSTSFSSTGATTSATSLLVVNPHVKRVQGPPSTGTASYRAVQVGGGGGGRGYIVLSGVYRLDPAPAHGHMLSLLLIHTQHRSWTPSPSSSAAAPCTRPTWPPPASRWRRSTANCVLIFSI